MIFKITVIILIVILLSVITVRLVFNGNETWIDRYLGLEWKGHLLFAVAALFLGLALYGTLQVGLQKRMTKAVLNANIIEDFCKRKAGLEDDICVDRWGNGEDSDQLIWSIMLDAKIIDPTQVGNPSQLSQLATIDRSANAVADFLRRQQATTVSNGLDLLIATTEICASSFNQINADLQDTVDPTMYKAGLKNISAAYLAGSYAEDYENLSIAVSDADEDFVPLSYVPPKPMLLRRDPDGLTYGWTPKAIQERHEGIDHRTFGESFRLSLPRSVTDSEVVSMLLAMGGSYDEQLNGYKVANRSSCSHLASLENATERDYFNAFRNFEQLAMYLGGLIKINTTVRTARNAQTIVTGPEQLIIMVLGVYGLLLGLTRLLLVNCTVVSGINYLYPSPLHVTPQMVSEAKFEERDQAFDKLASAKWPMRLVMTLLPAIGFVGTVRGIMNSLSGADQIIWAANANERSAAISALSGDLGLAFATTMLALIFGVGLSIISAQEGRTSERILLKRFD